MKGDKCCMAGEVFVSEYYGRGYVYGVADYDEKESSVLRLQPYSVVMLPTHTYSSHNFRQCGDIGETREVPVRSGELSLRANVDRAY